MSSKPIAFFDSGIGGIPYLSLARSQLGGEEWVYLGDDAHFPYGTKRREELIEIVLSQVGTLVERFDPAAVVVACNTASVVALAALRERFSLPFVGVVPAVKPAAARSAHRRIGLLATNRTVGDAYVDGLVQAFAQGCTVVRIAGQELVDYVEHQFCASPAGSSVATIRAEGNAVLARAVEAVRAENVDTLVLGCTHFTFLDDYFRSALGDRVAVIDSRDGVIRQLTNVLSTVSGRGGGSGRAVIYHSGVQAERYRFLAERFALEYGGRLV